MQKMFRMTTGMEENAISKRAILKYFVVPKNEDEYNNMLSQTMQSGTCDVL